MNDIAAPNRVNGRYGLGGRFARRAKEAGSDGVAQVMARNDVIVGQFALVNPVPLWQRVAEASSAREAH